ncbi:MAG: alpha/beta fold hydrolase [Bryobacteraceae bacterium]|nr:alpha/beta fold hydrolase [Bryobacteraceae bacterium]
MIGERVGPYEVVEKIGEGGMGVVYKARDTRLGRWVALKRLHGSAAKRFEREARAIAALAHPNICALYDIGENYLVMEYVAGAAVHGPQPIDTALRIAAQVASALASAHAAGIVHRDVKPSNLILTADGLVKVLDFGLAKRAGAGESALSDEPTASFSPTHEGTIVGSVPYMSPEQAEGKPVDPRSDIFSFGSVMYELFTGQRAFEGGSRARTLARVLNDEPRALSELVAGIPPSVEGIVLRCLRKEPARRWQRMEEVKAAIEDAIEERRSTGQQRAAKRSIVYSFGPFRLNPVERQLIRNGRPVAITPKALELLTLLVENQGHVLSKDELMKRVWADAFVEESNLVQNISVLRRLLGQTAAGEFIETVPRFGYRWVAAVESNGETPSQAPAVSAPADPETRYARSGDVNIAYQVLGDGPIDLVFVMGWVSHLEYFWREPNFARFLRRLASFSRLILFDKRGTGLSDRVPLTALPTLEQRMDDVRAVLSAAGSNRAAVFGVSEGGPMSALFAATYPEQCQALVMVGSYARRLRDENYPWGPTAAEREVFLRKIRDEWGGPVGIEERAPSMAGDPAFREWWSVYLRMGASPGAAIALTQMNAEIDVRHVLPSVRVPALVIHRTGDQVFKIDEGRYIASLIPGAKFAELPGDDHLPFCGRQEDILAEVEDFLARVRSSQEVERVLATVLIVDAPPSMAAEVGREIAAHRGHETPPHAVFDGPARAIRCASAILARGRRAGVEIRAGLHTGECDRLGSGAISGVAVEIAERVLEAAPPGTVVVSNTVRDLVAGSGLAFAPMAGAKISTPHGEWRLFRVAA